MSAKRYCKSCNKGTQHLKIKGLNTVQKIVGGSVLLFCGCPPIFDEDKFECVECGTKRK